MATKALWMAALALAGGCTKDASRDKEHVETDTATTTDSKDTANPTSSVSDRRIDDAGAGSIDSDKVQLCTLTNGSVVVVWADDREGERGIWGRRSPDGGLSWPDAPTRINSDSANADEPVLACDGDVAYAAWEDDRDSEIEDANIYFSTSVGGATWSADLRVAGTDLGSFDHLEPQLAVAGAEVHVVWHSDDNGAFDIYAASSTDGGASFASPVRVDSDSPGAAWSSHPAVATDGLGRVYIAWEDRRAGVGDIYVAVSSNSGTSFGQDIRLDSGLGDSFRPEIAAAAGEAYIGWYDERDGEKLEVYAAYSDDGGASWATAERLSEGTPGEKDSILPRLVLEGGTLHVTWFQAGGGGFHTEYRQVEAGLPSTEIIQLDHAPNAAQTTYPRIAASDGGWLVAWRDDRAASGDDDNDLYYSYSTDDGASWSPDLRIDAHPAGSTFAVDHSVAVIDGGLVAAWSDGRNGSADVFFTRLNLGEEATE